MDPWILRLESWKKKYRNLNPPAFRNDGGFWFLDWNESGFEMRIYEEVFEEHLR